MNETSPEYQAGFARLLPELVWTTDKGISVYLVPGCYRGQPPDIRLPEYKALAWDALVAVLHHYPDTFDVWAQEDYGCHEPILELYKAIESIGRES